MKPKIIERRTQKEIAFIDESVAPCQVPIDRYFTEINGACARLDETERKAIYLRFWCDTKIARIADVLGLSWDETNWLLDRAVIKINRALTRRLRASSAAAA